MAPRNDCGATTEPPRGHRCRYGVRVELAAEMDALTQADLRARGSLKWTLPPVGQIGTFVAEMDLPLAPVIRDAVTEAVQRGLTTYLPPYLADRAAVACATFLAGRHGWDVDPASIHVLSGVLDVVKYALRHLLPADTPLVVPTPTYMPFLKLPQVLGTELRLVPMTHENGRYHLDLDALRPALAGGALLMLINPHNPTGRVFTRAELQALAELVEETGATVLADEIHAPLVYPGARHVPYASLSPITAGHTITAVSASKGWNVPGLSCAQIVLTGSVHRKRWADTDIIASYGAAPLGAIAAEAAYLHGVGHLDACVEYLDRGRAVFADALAAALPAARFGQPEGTYLGWIDLRDVADPASVADRCDVLAVDGAECGAPGFLRVNLATSHPILTEMARRLGRLDSPASP